MENISIPNARTPKPCGTVVGIRHAYERTSMIITTNLPFAQWIEVCGNERLTGAMLDRLTHKVHIIEANGESFRLKEAKRRRQSAKK